VLGFGLAVALEPKNGGLILTSNSVVIAFGRGEVWLLQ